MDNAFKPEIQNKEIRSAILESIKTVFPISKNGKQLVLKNIKIEDELDDNDFPLQKEIKLNRKSWQNPILATIQLTDEKTGKVINESKNIKIGNIPKITNRFSTIIDGNEYQTINQIRRKSGVYSRIKKNGELETEFNLAKGANFRMELDQTNQTFYIYFTNRKYRLWTLLHILGISDIEMEKSWGRDLLEINKRGALNTEVSEITSIYEKLYKKENKNYDNIIKELKEYFNNYTELDPDTTNITLGHTFEKASPQCMLIASKKLLNINKGIEQPDERDSLIFKKIYSPGDLLVEYFKANAPIIQKKITRTLGIRDNIKDMLSAGTFGEPIKKFFTVSDVSSPNPQTNPVTIIAEARKTTPMGEGGIGDTHSITLEMRDVHPTQLGFLDPLATPEGQKVGVTIGLASEVQKVGNDMGTPVINKNGDIEWLNPAKFFTYKIGFPDQCEIVNDKPKAISNVVMVMHKGDTIQVPANQVDYYIHRPASMFSFQTNLVPFIPNTQGNRASTAGRMITQALALDQKEKPLVQVAQDDDNTYEQVLGSYLNPTSDVHGVVTKIDKNYMHIKHSNGVKKIGLYNDFPLNQDGYLNSKPLVKVGDKVTPNTVLSENNYTVEDTLSLGKNLTVAYTSYFGKNFEDGVVITESAAKKLSHTMIHQSTVSYTPKKSIFDKTKFVSWYPDVLSQENFSKLDERGIVKIGSKVSYNDVICAYLQEREMDENEKSLQKLNKLIFNTHAKKVTYWEDEDTGEVTDVRDNGRTIDIYIKAVHPMKEGDKLSGRFGNKGIVTTIIPDSDAPHRPNGEPVEVILSAEGVPGRMNLGQIMETAAAKIAEKRGKPFIVNNFESVGEDQAKNILKEMKAIGVEPNEILTDGRTGEKIQTPIFVGKQYMMKLRHIINKKSAAHNIGQYDVDEVASGKGAQKAGHMEVYSYLAHGAKNILREVSEIKGRSNEEYWRDLQFGLPPKKPNRNFIFEKMITYLKGAGVNVEKSGNRMQLLPMTDDDVLKMSNGEIKDPGALLIGKNLATRKDGLFDKEITGGPKGTNWAHVELKARIPNPLFEDAIMKLLQLTEKKYDAIISGKEELNNKTGIPAITDALKSFDVNKNLKEMQEQLKVAAPTNVNKLNTTIRYLQNLKNLNVSPEKAYTLQNLPIIPPAFRQIYALPSGDLSVNDINQHYKAIGVINKNYKEAIDKNVLSPKDHIDTQYSIYNAFKALQGLIEPATYGKRKYKGILNILDQKDVGVIDKSWAKRQDISMRSTITVEPDLNIDQVGIPKHFAYEMFKPFIIRDMKQSGITASQAKKYYDDEHDLAKQALQNVARERPVLLNRAPTLHKHNIQAFWPVLTESKSIKLNPLIFKGFNADLDGDEQINSVVIYINKSLLSNIDFSLDTYKKFSYIQSINNSELLTKTQNFMSSRFNVKLPTKTDGIYLITNLEDFPYDRNNLLGTKDHIDFYAVPNGIQVVAYDENKNELVLTDVSGWSVHKNREVWTITLGNDRQIISDDDPRAVYGIKADTLEFTRSAPIGALRMLVPIAKSTDNVKNRGWELTEIDGIKDSKIKDKIKLNKEVGYTIGALIGDGWTDSQNNKFNRVNLAGVEKPVIAQYTKFLSNIFNEEPHIGHRISLDSYGQSEKHTVSSVDFATWIAPFIGKGAINKHLPTFWFNTTYEFKIGLLSGLLDTDGCISVSHSKEKPQLIISFDSISIRLIQEVQHLLLSLGVRSKICFSKKTSVGNDFWHLSISSVDFQKIKDDLIIAHESNIKALLTPVDTDAPSSVRTDLVPITNEIISTLIKKINNRRYSSFYSSLMQAKKKYYISRKLAVDVIAIHGEENLPKKWLKIVNNDSITWSPVVKVENTGKKETGYDLTVPGYETFMSIDGIILSNTMSINVPIEPEAVNEAIKIMPSKILFKHGDNTLMPELSKDYIYGLHQLSLINNKSTKVFNTIEEAKKSKIPWTTEFTLDGKNITIGQYLINEKLPEELKKYDREMTGKITNALLIDIGKKYPSKFADVISSWKQLGSGYSSAVGHTISITDFDFDRSFRDEKIKNFVPKIEQLKSPAEKIKAYTELIKSLEIDQNKLLSKNNNLKKMLDSGSFGKTDSVRQVLTAPGLLTGVGEKVIGAPVLRSYGEGLDTASFWNTMYGVRKGYADKGLTVQDTGALNNALLHINRRTLITSIDCNTDKGLEFDLDDKNALDRCLLESISGVGKRNEVVNSEIILKAKSKNIFKLKVRSPLTCEAVNGICQKCYGLMPNGSLPNMGEAVGVLESQALSERATQLALRTFHTGGSLAGASSLVGGLPRVEQLLKVPDKLSNKATLAAEDGTVNNIQKNPIGGYDIIINFKKYTTAPGLALKIQVNDKVKKGDPLSEGAIKPQELGEFKDHLTAQQYIINELNGLYENKFHKKTFETILRGISDNASVTKAPDDSGFLRGDKTTISYLQHLNREREKEKLEKIEFKPYFKSIDTLNLDQPDWLTKLTTNRVKQALIGGVSKGEWANIKGKDPVNALVYGEEFGRNLKPEEGVFY